MQNGQDTCLRFSTYFGSKCSVPLFQSMWLMHPRWLILQRSYWILSIVKSNQCVTLSTSIENYSILAGPVNQLLSLENYIKICWRTKCSQTRLLQVHTIMLCCNVNGEVELKKHLKRKLNNISRIKWRTSTKN